MFIWKSPVVVPLGILTTILVYFRFLTGFFLPIKPEVDTLRPWDLDQTWKSRVFRIEWGVNHFCRITFGFYRKWVIGPEIRDPTLTLIIGKTEIIYQTHVLEASLPKKSTLRSLEFIKSSIFEYNLGRVNQISNCQFSKKYWAFAVTRGYQRPKESKKVKIWLDRRRWVKILLHDFFSHFFESNRI